MLLIYYTAVLASVIYLTTVFGFSLKNANGLGNWNWGFNVIAVILVGFISDRFRVRKPFMVIGGVLAAVMTVIYLEQAGHHPGYYTLALMLALLSLGLGIAYTPWMASYTETVEARNPALIATGLAIWGWIIRVVVFVAYLMPSAGDQLGHPAGGLRVHRVGLRDHVRPPARVRHRAPDGRGGRPEGPPVGRGHRGVDPAGGPWPPRRRSPRRSWPPRRRTPRSSRTRPKFAPELAVIQAHPTLFAKLATYTEPGHDPGLARGPGGHGRRGRRQGPRDPYHDLGQPGGDHRRDRGRARAAGRRPVRGGPEDHRSVLDAADDHRSVLGRVDDIAPYGASPDRAGQGPAGRLRLPAGTRRGGDQGRCRTASQWKTWYWICFGGIIFFLLSIPLLRGRWRPRDARRDEAEHEAKVEAELAKLNAPRLTLPVTAGCPRSGPAAGGWRWPRRACGRRARPRRGRIHPVGPGRTRVRPVR